MESKKTWLLIAILVVLVIIAGALLAIKIVNDNTNTEILSNDIVSLGVETGKVKEEKKVKIYSGNDRPIAVMIDNNKNARPHAGLNDAYMVYEIIVEGGETRLMALFKGKDLEKIGPIRSSRHYFLDYAMENDAIYVHFGWSPQAESDISTYKVNNINGLVESPKDFWRVKDKKAPHNAVTSTKKILEIATRKKYRTTSDTKSVLNYNANEIDLGEITDIPTNETIEETQASNKKIVKSATEVEIPYPNETVTYKYNEETKRYTRWEKTKAQTDWDTKEEVTTKNIIITFIENYTLKDTENKGRQGLKNIGDKKGYYITNGKAIEIVCSKETRTDKTVYKDLEGNIIEVNDGNTFVQICPIDSQVVIK